MNNLPWHIPKRSNLLQIVGSLHIIKDLNFDGKQWTKNNTKRYNQSLGTWGLTQGGNSLSSTARETLEALIKYLGFLYIDKNHNAHITPAGYKLMAEFSSFKKPETKIKLRHSEKINNFITSNTVKYQLIKLVISNPTIEERLIGKDTILKPFVETLRYLLDKEIGFLLREEMAMYVFFQQKPQDFIVIKGNILKYRSLIKEEQIKTVNKFAQSYIGNKIYGESSATVKYWEAIVKITGMFENKIGFFLKKDAKKEAESIVKIYEYPELGTFTNEAIWWEYFGNDSIQRYPRKISYLLPNLKGFKLIFSYKPTNKFFIEYFEPKLKVDGDIATIISVFPNIEYNINFKVLLDNSGKCCDINFKKIFYFNENEYYKEIIDNVSIKTLPLPSLNFKEDLMLILEKNSLSKQYLDSTIQLLLLTGIVSNNAQAEKFLKNRMALIKGGRFEKLFYELLQEKEKIGVIDNVVEWRGREENGLYYPSPAGTGFETDIEFIVDKYYFGFELTTALGRAQWKTEAESVTDHIQNLREKVDSKKNNYKTVGIFTAPQITKFMEAICFYFSEFIYKLPIIAIPGKELFEMFEKSHNKEELLEKIKNYYKNIFKREL